jgi:zinc protease
VSELVTQRPGPSQPRPYRFPDVVRRTAAGSEVVAAHLPGHPLAVAALLLDAGAGREPAGREGVASVLADALEEGTLARDSAG